MARVLFLDPYHGPSHCALSTVLRDRSRHDVALLTLPPRKWKWRMRGAALAFEAPARALARPPQILVATDMLNLPELLGLLRGWLPPSVSVITYFHENQLTYPTPSSDERDFHFGLCNVYSALASDRVVFNSQFHRDEFIAAVPALLRRMPDHRPEGIAERIRERSDVLGVPLDLEAAPVGPPAARREGLVLWNHRWEEDKDPEAFFRVMERLDRRGVPFKMMVLGQSFRDHPDCFARAARDLAHRIERWGYVPDRADYLRSVARCRVVVSTARQEFFGLAVREAIALGCYPLLPRRLVYPELARGRPEHLYDTEEELVERLAALLGGTEPVVSDSLVAEARALAAPHVVSAWDQLFDSLAGR